MEHSKTLITYINVG